MPDIKEKIKKYLLDSTNIGYQQFFVAKVDGRIVVFGRIIDHEKFFETASLGVNYYYRGKGLGTKMIIFLVEEAKRMNPKKPIYGVTHRPNFFKKVGFEIAGAYPDYFDYKKNRICKYPSKIEIMKYKEKTWVSKTMDELI